MKSIYIHRDIEENLKEALNQFPVVALTGSHQTGKSTLLKHCFEQTHHYVTFDDPLNRERAHFDPKAFLESLGGSIILDEIQYIPELLSYIKILVDEQRDLRGRFLLTGSQQFHLIKNLGDTLAGRVALFELMPFSLSEKQKIPDYSSDITSEAQFVEACLRGSYPEISTRPLNAQTWYASYIQTYLERDVRGIYDVGNLRDFERFLILLASRCAQILNMSSIASELGIAVNTVKRWLSILEASRIIFLLPPFATQTTKRLVKNPKIYFLDCGLVSYLLSLRDQAYLLQGPFAGPLFENFCIQETVKRFLNAGKTLFPLSYLRTSDGLEIDLFIEQGGSIRPIEFKRSKTIRFSMADSFQRLKKNFPKIHIEQGCIVSLSDYSEPLTPDVCAKTLNDYLTSCL